MIFYQAPAYYPGFAQSARHTMLVRLEPYTAEGSVEEGEVSAFASGDHIAANTYLRGKVQGACPIAIKNSFTFSCTRSKYLSTNNPFTTVLVVFPICL